MLVHCTPHAGSHSAWQLYVELMLPGPAVHYVPQIEALRAALAAPPPEQVTPDADAVVDEYADEYEYDDGECGHIPSDEERILLADFGHGLVSLLHERGLLAPRLLTEEGKS
jgi:hypothetical protein